jgi:RNA polymerase sigma-70 factor (ECF subfamily)
MESTRGQRTPACLLIRGVLFCIHLKPISVWNEITVSIYLSSSDEDFIRRFTSIQSDLRTFLVGMTPTRADADDVLQEVNLALWRKRNSFDPSRDFRHWAFAFAMTEIRSFRRDSARSRMWFKDEALESLAEAWPTDAAENEEHRDALLSCLQKLGAVELQYVTQYYGKQLSIQDLAASYGRPLSTVYKVLSRARKQLRNCVERSLAQTGRSRTLVLPLLLLLLM